MNITTAKPRPMRINQRAQLVPVARYAEWHERAILTPGLTDLDRALLAVVAGGIADCKLNPVHFSRRRRPALT
jgi:hypothetical protein